MLYQRYQPQFHRLHRLWDVLPVLTAEEQDYVGVFIPGTLLSQPSDVDVAETIRWTMRRDRYLIAICHGPEVILTLAQGDSPQRRDVLAASPDSADR
ncbi:hypothetical protein MAY76_15890 [Edwardsiella ictaluri]|nr:hypothetical protein [Edwardsiella ictaluri]WFO09614.1 hypothetical protein MAY76_15890 [Edwardsiella ictaluri]WFO12525.1 hypothetical protein MAY82_15945 [Edwardsiella ictaluri]